MPLEDRQPAPLLDNARNLGALLGAQASKLIDSRGDPTGAFGPVRTAAPLRARLAITRNGVAQVGLLEPHPFAQEPKLAPIAALEFTQPSEVSVVIGPLAVHFGRLAGELKISRRLCPCLAITKLQRLEQGIVAPPGVWLLDRRNVQLLARALTARNVTDELREIDPISIGRNPLRRVEPKVDVFRTAGRHRRFFALAP